MILLKRLLYKSHYRVAAAFFGLLLLISPLLASCGTPAPLQMATIDLGIPQVALNSPVVGPLPDNTQLRVGITFKVSQSVLDKFDRQKIQPGHKSNLEKFANQIGKIFLTLKASGCSSVNCIPISLLPLKLKPLVPFCKLILLFIATITEPSMPRRHRPSCRSSLSILLMPSQVLTTMVHLHSLAIFTSPSSKWSLAILLIPRRIVMRTAGRYCQKKWPTPMGTTSSGTMVGMAKT